MHTAQRYSVGKAGPAAATPFLGKYYSTFPWFKGDYFRLGSFNSPALKFFLDRLLARNYYVQGFICRAGCVFVSRILLCTVFSPFGCLCWSRAGVAQRRSTAFVKLRLWVRVPPPALFFAGVVCSRLGRVSVRPVALGAGGWTYTWGSASLVVCA